MVLVIDESGSIGSYRNEVATACSAFWTSLGAILNVGGTATLGLIEFSSSARLVKGPVLRSVDPAYITELDQYVTSTSGGTSGYNPGGCTDWGEALDMVRTTPWTITGVGPTQPDITIFFTDGVPTIFNGECNRDCPAGVSFATTGGYNDVDDVAVACYAADRLKQAGTKIFLVGVGGVAGNDYKMEGVTGTAKWDQQVSTFATSDYIPDPDLANLGAILYNVAVGLCPCLQQQPLCTNDVTDYNGVTRPCIVQFSARVRISSVGGSVSYPAFGESVAYIYYDFSSSVDQRVAYQFFDPSAGAGMQATLPPISAAAGSEPNVLREDIHAPCEVTRKVQCTAGCFSISDKQFVPRFFHEASDTLDVAAVPPNPSDCPVKYAKQVTAATPLIPEEVAFIWGADVPGQGFVLCAAVTNDGTIFEFLDATVPTSAYGITQNLNHRPAVRPGVTGITTGVYDFDATLGGSCLTPICGTNVELVFVVDEQNPDVKASDFTNMKDYIQGIVDLFDEKPLIRFASVWSNNLNPTFDAFQNSHTSYKNSVAGHTKENSPNSQTDFSAAITFAINQAWPAPKTTSSVARHLVVLVGGADSRGTPPTGNDPWPAVRQLIAARDVEVWGVGVGNVGGSNVALLTEFVSPKATHGYFHGVQFPASALLRFDVPFMGSRLCPGDASLCSGCNGFCACPGDCRCPACVDTPCGARQCLSPQTGCVGDSFACTDNDLCTNDVCIVDPTAMNGRRCVHTPVDCNDFDACTVDTCAPGIGCVNQPKVCNDNDVCTTDTCNPQTGECVFTPLPTCPAICSPNPCPVDGTNCTDHFCVFADAVPATPVAGALYCQSPEITGQARTDCMNAIASGPGYYCHTTPPKTCPGNPCQTEQCDAATGLCVQLAPTNCDDGNPCTTDTCDPMITMGSPCVNTPVQCPLLDQCVNRMCTPTPNAVTGLPYTCVDNGAVTCAAPQTCETVRCQSALGCVYEPILCNVSSACNIAKCDNSTGVCVEEVLASLLDFCGTCGGDNVACFFKDLKDVRAAAGLAAGIIAGIVLAAVFALLIAAFLLKKGYDHFSAAGQLASASANVNPTFVGEQGKRGSMGRVF